MPYTDSMFRRFHLFLIVFLSLFFFYSDPTLAASGASMNVSPARATYDINSSFTLNINLDTGNAGTLGTDLIMSFDNSILEVVDIRPGSVYSTYIGKTINNSGGTLRISGIVQPGEVYKGSGVFVTLVMKAKKEGSANVSFLFTPQDRNDSNVATYSGDILASVQNGEYTIKTKHEEKSTEKEGNAFTRAKILKRLLGSFKFRIELKELLPGFIH